MVIGPDDKEWIRLTSKEIIRNVVSGVIASHIENCPYGKKQYGFKQLLIGIGIGSVIFGSGLGIANIFSKIASLF